MKIRLALIVFFSGAVAGWAGSLIYQQFDSSDAVYVNPDLDEDTVIRVATIEEAPETVVAEPPVQAIESVDREVGTRDSLSDDVRKDKQIDANADKLALLEHSLNQVENEGLDEQQKDLHQTDSTNLLPPIPTEETPQAELVVLEPGEEVGNEVIAEVPDLREFSEDELEKIGKRIWQSECSGTVEGLTSWNKGEPFASLGIGHFLWFPEGSDAIFDESFPTYLSFARSLDESPEIPDWILPATPEEVWPPCPWSDRDAFLADFESVRMEALRSYLVQSVPTQARFLVSRFRGAFVKIAAATEVDREDVAQKFVALTETPEGTFAMIDYINFKGEGTKLEERYNDEGWGLLQVLQGMDKGAEGSREAVIEFSKSAERVLTRRTVNNPSDQVWLRGWRNRVRAYQQPF